MRVFVYYNDDHAGNAGIGLKECSSRDEASAFIEKRMSENARRTVADYRVIEGNELTIHPVAVVSKIRLTQ